MFQDSINEDSASKRAEAAKTWKSLIELKLRMQMKPAPRSVDVTHRKVKRNTGLSGKAEVIPIEEVTDDGKVESDSSECDGNLELGQV